MSDVDMSDTQSAAGSAAADAAPIREPNRIRVVSHADSLLCSSLTCGKVAWFYGYSGLV